ncbi:MAG: isoleucine--tRNA ligase [Candidatus Kerfeldbacteria bacterium]
MGKVQKPQKKSMFSEFEEEIIAFWKTNKCFEKSVEIRPDDKHFIFYDGPPFATGLPHYGHMLSSVVKDMVPRHWTMRGYRVERRWGWDCHGLPIENLIEKEIGLNSRKEIEEYGIDKFNAACKDAILMYDKEWGKFVERIGRWIDFENSYKTMDNTYMESVWWAFKEMYDKGLVYEGRRVSLYCPRCATPLSNFEIAMDNSFKDVEDHSITVKFIVKGEEKTSFLAWTTTPWTLPGNVALVVDEQADYVKVEQDGEFYYCADAAKDRLFDSPNVVEKLKGADLVGKEYEPLYTYMPTEGKKAYYVLAGDFVELEEGTGVVHTAAIFGEDDFRLAEQADLPRVPTLDEQGKFLDFVTPFAGKFYKSAEKLVNADLEERGLMFKAEKYSHSYPFCWRCDTPLYYFAGPAWFIAVGKIKDDMLKQNQEISWHPDHLKYGRFAKGIESAPDWNISRSRFWGTAMPVWKCSKCAAVDVNGSVADLQEKCGKDLSELDLHRPSIDEITYPCPQCKGEMKRIQDVFDTWVDSGSMPFAEKHYPFENKELFEKFYPADFIAEYIAQTRGWFYTLHVLSTALFEKPSFSNCVTTGTLMAEDGQKMSKKLKNYPDPQVMFDKYSVDAVRHYLLSSSIMDAQKVNFSERDVDEIHKKYINTLWNVYTFYKMFSKEGEAVEEIENADEVENVLDQWIMAKLHAFVKEVTEAYDGYNIRKASLPLQDFVQELSTWYIRRSRSRFKGDDGKDRETALRVLYTVLKTFIKVACPDTPFVTEKIFQELRKDDEPISVHHCDWPKADEAFMDDAILQQMDAVRAVVETSLGLRAEAGMKVRQPLQSVTITGSQLSEEYQEILQDELNVKEVLFGDAFALNTEISDELRLEGTLRELIRQTNSLRKKTGLTIDDVVGIKLQTDSEQVKKAVEIHKEEYLKSVIGKSIEIVSAAQESEGKVDGESVTMSLTRG